MHVCVCLCGECVCKNAPRDCSTFSYFCKQDRKVRTDRDGTLRVHACSACMRVFRRVLLSALHQMSPCEHTTQVNVCVLMCVCLLSGRWQEWYKHLRINISVKLQPSARQQTNINTVFSYSAISLSPCIAPLFSLFSRSAVLPSIIIRRQTDDLSTPATILCPSFILQKEEKRGAYSSWIPWQSTKVFSGYPQID